jgi:hypothetical protein
MIRCSTDARAHAAADDPTAYPYDAREVERRWRLDRFVRDLGFPASAGESVVARFRRERGAMTAEEAAAHLAAWIGEVRETRGVRADVSVADATESFVVSGAAMWGVEVLFSDPTALSAAHVDALAAGRGRVVPVERPLAMPPQDLSVRWRRRRPVEPVARRLSWVPSR